MTERRRERLLKQAALSLARHTTDEEIARTAVRAIAGMLGPRDEVVVNRFDGGGERYVVLEATAEGATGERGRVADHPVLGRLSPVDEPQSLRTDGRLLDPALARHLEAGSVRTLVHRPLGDVGCVLILRRGRTAELPEQAEAVCVLASTALTAWARRRELERERARSAAAAETVRTLFEAIRHLDQAGTVEEVVGVVLRTTQRLDAEVVGAVVGVVTDGVVVRVSAVGTTPRSFVESLKGTRLQGFEIGRRLVERREPIFTGPDEVTLATRTKVMEPLGAESLLVAGGVDADTVRLVVSSYRRSPEPPPGWSLWSTASLLDHAASILRRLDPGVAEDNEREPDGGEPAVADLGEHRTKRAR